MLLLCPSHDPSRLEPSPHFDCALAADRDGGEKPIILTSLRRFWAMAASPCAGHAAQAQTAEVEISLQMSEAHLDLAAGAGGTAKRLGPRRAGNVLAYIFMRVDGQHPGRSLGTLRLERATRAITTARAIDQYAIAAIKRERQLLATRACIGIVRAVEGEFVACEAAVGLRAAVKHRNVRFDAALHQPGQIAAGTIGCVRRQVLGQRSKRSLVRSIMVRVAATSAVQRAGLGSTSTMTAALVSIRWLSP
jgi:hypothetical protein